ncbi:hypothetical protein E1171_07245 [Cytophagales bacterium RKSG123]|nr:hypothetical protein [Xanthovirga aplysinae]
MNNSLLKRIDLINLSNSYASFSSLLMKRYNIIAFLMILVCFTSFTVVNAQTTKPNKKVMELFKEAKQQMGEGNYESANITFRKMLATRSVLPTEMSYYFAQTLFQIGQFRNSQNFLNKYLDLNGKGAEFYNESIALQDKLDRKLNKAFYCSLCDLNGYKITPCETCKMTGKIQKTCPYCRGQSLARCTLCNGKTVTVKKNVFGEFEYRTCQQCKGKGYSTCELCHGTGLLETNCPDCDGKGHQSTNEICTHPNLEEE